MTILLFEKTKPKQFEEQQAFLQGAISALSYLETMAFKDNLFLLRVSIRLAQLAAMKEQQQSFRYRKVKDVLKNLVDELEAIPDTD